VEKLNLLIDCPPSVTLFMRSYRFPMDYDIANGFLDGAKVGDVVPQPVKENRQPLIPTHVIITSNSLYSVEGLPSLLLHLSNMHVPKLTIVCSPEIMNTVNDIEKAHTRMFPSLVKLVVSHSKGDDIYSITSQLCCKCVCSSCSGGEGAGTKKPDSERTLAWRVLCNGRVFNSQGEKGSWMWVPQTSNHQMGDRRLGWVWGDVQEQIEVDEKNQGDVDESSQDSDDDNDDDEDDDDDSNDEDDEDSNDEDDVSSSSSDNSAASVQEFTSQNHSEIILDPEPRQVLYSRPQGDVFFPSDQVASSAEWKALLSKLKNWDKRGAASVLDEDENEIDLSDHSTCSSTTTTSPSDSSLSAPFSFLQSDHISNPSAPLLTVIGTGSSTPSLSRGPSAIFIKCPSGESVLLDCGEGTCEKLDSLPRQTSAGWRSNLKMVFITHRHLDHYGGVFTLVKECAKHRRKQIFGGLNYCSSCKGFFEPKGSTQLAQKVCQCQKPLVLVCDESVKDMVDKRLGLVDGRDGDGCVIW